MTIVNGEMRGELLVHKIKRNYVCVVIKTVKNLQMPLGKKKQHPNSNIFKNTREKKRDTFRN